MEQMLGGARITYLGHSAFRFVTAGDEQIIIDPLPDQTTRIRRKISSGSASSTPCS